ncbi:MAG: type II toxin-antitoxin system VapC family toxin [Planctomycetaceae bacterium]
MIVLDTDHLSVLAKVGTWRSDGLADRLSDHRDEGVVTTIVCVEENLRGWLADIHRAETLQDEKLPYERLAELIEFLSDWEILRLDDVSINRYDEFRRQRIRVAPHDLKIASIALTNDALLLSANLKDFEKVPGLRVENWLEL